MPSLISSENNNEKKGPATIWVSASRVKSIITIENIIMVPLNKKMYLIPCATGEGTDRAVQMRNLIRIFHVHLRKLSSRKHAYIILTLLNPTFI